MRVARAHGLSHPVDPFMLNQYVYTKADYIRKKKRKNHDRDMSDNPVLLLVSRVGPRSK